MNILLARVVLGIGKDPEKIKIIHIFKKFNNLLEIGTDLGKINLMYDEMA